jgi:hypothetical protein
VLASLGWQNITTWLAGAGIVIAATVSRNTWRRRRERDRPTEAGEERTEKTDESFSGPPEEPVAATAPRRSRPGIEVDWGRLRLWHVVLVVVFVFSLVVIVTTKNSDNRQGAWGLLGLVVGAVLPKGT